MKDLVCFCLGGEARGGAGLGKLFARLAAMCPALGRPPTRGPARPISAFPKFFGQSRQAKFLGRAGLRHFLFLGWAGRNLGGPSRDPSGLGLRVWTFVTLWSRHKLRHRQSGGAGLDLQCFQSLGMSWEFYL